MDVTFWTSSQQSNWSACRNVYVQLLNTHAYLKIPHNYILGREYAAADFRWGVSEPGVVSLELLTVFGAGTLCCYILKQLVNDDPARHYWLIILSTAELYGGFVP